MHGKVTIVVSRTQWRCVNCRLVNKHKVSIDDHVKTSHHDLVSHLLVPLICPSPDSHRGDCDEEPDEEGHLDSSVDISSPTQEEHVAKKTEPDNEYHVGRRTRHKRQAPEPDFKPPTRASKRLPAAAAAAAAVIKTEEEGEHHAVQEGRSERIKKKQLKLSVGENNSDYPEDKTRRRKRKGDKEDDPDYHEGKGRRRKRRNNEENDPGFTEEKPRKDERHDEENVSGQQEKGTRRKKRTNHAAIKRGSTDGDSQSGSAQGTPEGKNKRSVVGGKPVKRNLEVKEKQKTRLVERYLGIKAASDSDNEGSSSPAAASLEKGDGSASPDLSMKIVGYKESVPESNRDGSITQGFRAGTNQGEPVSMNQHGITEDNTEHKENPAGIMLAKRSPSVCLTAAESLSEQSVPVPGDDLRVTDKQKLESLDKCMAPSRIVTNASLTSMSEGENVATEVDRLTGTGAGMTQVLGVEMAVSSVYGSNTQAVQQSTHHNNSLYHVSSDSFPPAAHNLIQPQVNSQYNEYGYPASNLPEPNAGMTQYRLNTAVPSFNAGPFTEPPQLLPQFGNAQTGHFMPEENVANSSQAEYAHLQQAEHGAPEMVTDTAKEEETPESDEWIKNRVNFRFSIPKATSHFQQISDIHECKICRAKFSSPELLDAHKSKMLTDSTKQCKLCERLFHNVYDLSLHVFGEHEKKSKPFCFECGKNLHSMEAFEKHLFHHAHGREPSLLEMEFHCCQICNVDIPCRYHTLAKHYTKKHQVTTCLECFVRSKLIILSDPISVREHKDTHVNFCSTCIRDFPSSEAFDTHQHSPADCQYEEDGSGEKCDKCCQWCPNRAQAVLHQKEHKLQAMHAWRVEKWGVDATCIYCGKVLRNKRNLQRHISQMHSGSRSYRFHCEFCGKGVDSRNILKDHIALHHLGIKRYSCEFCPQRFVCAPTLRRHVLREHARDKQYTCEVCGEKFCEMFNLKKHMYIHTGSARFMCELCGKGFHSSSAIKRHTTVHVEKRHFICQGCGQGYKRKDALKRHVSKCSKAIPSDL